MVLAIVQSDDASNTTAALTRAGFGVTKLASSGGFLHQGSVTLVVGVDDAQVEQVLDILKATCSERTDYVSPVPPMVDPGEFFMSQPVEVQLGGATVFVLAVDRFERL